MFLLIFYISHITTVFFNNLQSVFSLSPCNFDIFAFDHHISCMFHHNKNNTVSTISLFLYRLYNSPIYFSYFIILLSHIKDWPSYFCSSLPPSSSLRIAQWCPPVLCKRICMRHSHSRLKIHWKTLFSATPRMVSQIFFVPLRCNAGLPLLLRMKNHGYLHQQGQQHVPRHRNARVCR